MIGYKTIGIFKAGARCGTAISLNTLAEAREQGDLDRLAGDMAHHFAEEVSNLLNDRNEIAPLIRQHLDTDDDAEIEL